MEPSSARGSAQPAGRAGTAPRPRAAPASQPAYLELAAALRAEILSGELKPGDRLPVEPDLSARYGVSRSTVREALRVLSSQHLVTTTRGVVGGSFVAHPRPEQISQFLETGLSLMAMFENISVDQLLEVRDMLEVPAAGIAAVRFEPDQLAELHDTLFDPRSVQADDLFPRNRSFHDVLLRMTGNNLLGLVTQPVFRVLHERFLREAAPKRFWRQVDADHREIFTAVQDRDGAAARDAMHEHLQRLRDTYTRIDRARNRTASSTTSSTAGNSTARRSAGRSATPGSSAARTGAKESSARSAARKRTTATTPARKPTKPGSAARAAPDRGRSAAGTGRGSGAGRASSSS